MALPQLTLTSVLAGPAGMARRLGLDRLTDKPSFALFDERHKYPHWKHVLKGFHDLRIATSASTSSSPASRTPE